MTHESGARHQTRTRLNDASVAEYLQSYPDFFERNAALLAKLRLPHMRDAGATVSLVERQVEVLRERNQSARAQAEGTGGRGARQRCSRRPHPSPDPAPDSAPHTLARDDRARSETSLREDFDARNSVLVLFLEARPRARAQPLPAKCRTRADAEDEVVRVAAAIGQASMRTGPRRAARLFSSARIRVEIGSVALHPLGPKGALGVLAIGASDAERFHPGMSTEFLLRIGELVTFALTR